jgi:hypothetical protein
MNPDSDFFIVFLIIAIIIAIYIFIKSIQGLQCAKRKNKEALTWSSTEGIITHSEVVFVIATGDDATYDHFISYQYTVDGKQYESKEIAFFNVGEWGGWGGKDELEKLAKKYPVDKQVTVFYNSSNPSEAVLEVIKDTFNVTVLEILHAIFLSVLLSVSFLLFVISVGAICQSLRCGNGG